MGHKPPVGLLPVNSQLLSGTEAPVLLPGLSLDGGPASNGSAMTHAWPGVPGLRPIQLRSKPQGKAPGRRGAAPVTEQGWKMGLACPSPPLGDTALQPEEDFPPHRQLDLQLPQGGDKEPAPGGGGRGPRDRRGRLGPQRAPQFPSGVATSSPLPGPGPASPVTSSLPRGLVWPPWTSLSPHTVGQRVVCPAGMSPTVVTAAGGNRAGESTWPWRMDDHSMGRTPRVTPADFCPPSIRRRMGGR